ncbi:MAG: tRNA (adenosine(37)-N6)-threonylcarbamoyltransferase complex ATPase subunit type 1 TsaE [Verrucomicrobiota bacterium]
MTLKPPFSVDSLRLGIAIETAETMEALGAWLVSQLPDDSVLTLSGTLGVGKTTLVRGIARALGIRETVSSPTFNIYNIYRGRAQQLIHMDAYRLESADDLEALMLDDFLASPWIWVVEWPENISSALPANRTSLELTIVGDMHWVVLKKLETT